MSMSTIAVAHDGKAVDGIPVHGFSITLRVSGAQLASSYRDTSLLEVLEHQRIPVEYQCRSGYCGTCRLRLVKGSVVYRQTPLACVQQDEILPCCCMPVNDIELEL